VAESFGANAERYDRARPSYPQAMIDRLVAKSPGREFLEVGIGTGISARQFRSAGCDVVGVDADARMAEVAEQQGFQVEVTKFEEWDPAGRRFDAVVAGQAWHWVDAVAGAKKAADSLRKSGRLAVFWNAGDPPEQLSESFTEVYRREVPDSILARRTSGSAVDSYGALCEKASAAMREVGAFEEPEIWRFDWERQYTREEWLDQLLTLGPHNLLSPEVLAKVVAGVGAVIDEAGGSFTVNYAAMVSTAARKATS
jgi:SAM-dependent methyltransferase